MLMSLLLRRWAIWANFQTYLVSLLAGHLFLGHAAATHFERDRMLLPHVRHRDILTR